MAWRASVPPANFGSSSRKPSSSTLCRNATTSGCGRITSATSSSASPISDVTLPGADSVRVSAAFFSPSHSCSWSLSHQVASIPAMIARMLDGSPRTRLCSWNASSRKSNSAGPVFVRMSRRRAAMEASLRAISSVTMAGSVSIGAHAPVAGGPPGPASGSVATKSWRSRTVSSASLISGSPLPTTSRRPARLAGDARRRVTSTNSLPPASCIGAMAVSCHTESPSGFMGSVIIC
jgi:hypothetical protein